jgi:hypothetical protein
LYARKRSRVCVGSGAAFLADNGPADSFKFSMNERCGNAVWGDYITFAAAVLQLFLATFVSLLPKG